MAKLGDYIGHLLSEINRARVQADMESINIANTYANHELLKTFPVPRVRLPNIEMNVPVVVESAELEAQIDIRKIDRQELVRATYSVLKDKLDRSQLEGFNRDEYQLMLSELYQLSDVLLDQLASGNNVDEVLLAYINNAIIAMARIKRLPKDVIKRITPSLRDELRLALDPLIPESWEVLTSVEIAPETFKLKEVGDTQKCLVLKLSITEDAVEWVTTQNDDGTTREFLVSE